MGIQLTFPAVFSEVASRGHLNSAYYPEPASRPMILPRDNDLQGNYHQQKMEDAHRMAMARVQASALAEQRYLNSHAGYYGMPKPVLGQRKYANPSNGNQADIYSNRPVWNSVYQPTSGGVLYTAEAQQWGRNKLNNRIAQLNAIDVAKQGFVSQYFPQGMPQGLPQSSLRPQMPQMESEPASAKANIELVQLLQSVSDSIEAGTVGQFAFNDVIKLLRQMFRWAASADVEELKEVYEYVDRNQQLLAGMEARAEEGADANEVFVKDIAPNLGTVSDIFRRLRKYLDGMIASVNKSPSERRSVSANLIKTLGFTKVRAAAQSAEAASDERLKFGSELMPYNMMGATFPDPYGVMKSPQMMAAPMGANPYESFAAEVFSPMTTPSSRRSGVSTPYAESGTATPRSKREAQFDPSVRDAKGAANGAYFGYSLPEEAESEINNAFRDLKDASLQSLEIPSEAVAESALASSAAATDSVALSRLGSRFASRAASPARAATAAVSEPARIKNPKGRQPIGQRLPTREEVNLADGVQLEAIAKRFRDAGMGIYNPKSSTSRKNIKAGILRVYNDYFKSL